MNYPPLFILIACIVIFISWFFSTSDYFLSEENSFSATPKGILWAVSQSFLIFISAGAAYTLIDTDWFLDNTGLSGDIPYYVGCIFAAYQTRETVTKTSNSIARGNLLSVQTFAENVARLFAVIVIPWIVLLLSLWITALSALHPIFAWGIAGLLCMAAYTGLSYVLFPESGNIVIRGMKEGTRDEAEGTLSQLREKREAGIYWAGTLLPFFAATGHFLAVGTTGSGKTITIKLLLNSIIRSIGISGSNHRAILFDAKRELYAYLLKLGIHQSLIHSLNPFDRRGARWNIAGDVTTDTQAVQLSHSLIPMPEDKGDNSYFGDTAREIFAGVIQSFNYLSDQQEAQGKPRIDWRLRDLVLAVRYEEVMIHLLKKCPETRHIIKKHFFSREIKSVLSTLGTAISAFNGVAALWEYAPYSIDLKKWAYDPDGSIIILGYDKEQSAALDPINQVIFRRLSDIVVNQSNSNQRRTWFFLDELRLISRGLPGLFELINMGREKGACCVLGVIDIKGLMKSLGEDTAEEITGLCDNVAGLRTRSAPTAEWLANMFGNAEVKELNQSIDAKGEVSTSEQINERKTFLSGQFQKIAKPSKLNGFTIGGYYLNGYTKPYFFNNVGVNSWLKTVPHLSDKEIEDEGVHPRPDSQQKLRLWDEKDLERLCIPEIDLKAIYDDPDDPGNPGNPDNDDDNNQDFTANFRL
jgi:hypothetical protein